MPNFDGTGPRGNRIVGRGRGNCGNGPSCPRLANCPFVQDSAAALKNREELLEAELKKVKEQKKAQLDK